jgi:hypothetical protein
MGWRESMGIKNSNPQEQKPQKPQKPPEQTPFATIAPFALEDQKTKTDQTPPPDLSRIQPEDISEYTDLWSRAHELADYIDGGTAPYEDRIKKLPELEKLVDKMKAIEADIKPVSKTGPNNRKFWDSMIRCRVGTRSSQQVEIQPDALGDDPGQCPACGERQWWRLNKPDSKRICARCHPPATGLDVILERI